MLIATAAKWILINTVPALSAVPLVDSPYFGTRPLRTVVLLRIVLWMSPQLNYALALTGISFRNYLLGSAFGLIWPIVIMALFFEELREVLARGLKVNPYQPNDPDEIAQLIEIGITGIITDFPQRVASARQSQIGAPA